MSKIVFGQSTKYDVLIGGDFCPFDSVANANLKIDEPLLAFIKQAKIRALNLECPLTHSATSIAKTGPALKSDPKAIALLRKFGVDFCNLANNHIMDYGLSGATDTQNYLLEAGIAYAGISGDPYNDVIVMDCDGHKVAFVSFTENEFSTLPENGIAATPMDYYIQLKQIQKAKETADFVIIMYHGGAELYPLPTPEQQRYAHYLADLGVSAVICHHSHCISGYELYRDVPIFYGLGNFYFPEKGNQDTWYRGLTLGISLNPEFSINIAPVRLDLASMTISLDLLEDLSHELGIYNKVIISENSLKQAWMDFCHAQELSTLSSLFNSPRLLRALMKRRVIGNYLLPKINLRLLNILRCETHREKLITTINYLLNKHDKDINQQKERKC